MTHKCIEVDIIQVTVRPFPPRDQIISSSSWPSQMMSSTYPKVPKSRFELSHDWNENGQGPVQYIPRDSVHLNQRIELVKFRVWSSDLRTYIIYIPITRVRVYYFPQKTCPPSQISAYLSHWKAHLPGLSGYILRVWLEYCVHIWGLSEI